MVGKLRAYRVKLALLFVFNFRGRGRAVNRLKPC